jgi:hypothetical protein
MKMRATSMVLLMIASAFAGCIGDSEGDDPLSGTSSLSGTSWVLYDLGHGYDEGDYESVWSFNDDGTLDVGDYGSFASLLPAIVLSYICDNGEVIRFSWVNDGVEDCEDGSDEGVSEGDMPEDGVGVGCIYPRSPREMDEMLCVEVVEGVQMMWSIDARDYLVISYVVSINNNNAVDDFKITEEDCLEGFEIFSDTFIRTEYSTMTGQTIDYSVSSGVTWDEEGGCEIRVDTTHIFSVEDGTILIHSSHPTTRGIQFVSVGGLSGESICLFGLAWTDLTHAENPDFGILENLRSSCLDIFLGPLTLDEYDLRYGDDANVWDCSLDVRLDSLENFSAESFEAKTSDHPGYPEWCGAMVPENLSLDGSEPNLPPPEDLYGQYWLGYGGYFSARSETRLVDSWYTQEQCIDPDFGNGTWDEDISMCSWPVDCESEADSQLVESSVAWLGWNSGYHSYDEWRGFCVYARYHWSGDYLYIGMQSNPSWDD